MLIANVINLAIDHRWLWLFSFFLFFICLFFLIFPSLTFHWQSQCWYTYIHLTLLNFFNNFLRKVTELLSRCRGTFILFLIVNRWCNSKISDLSHLILSLASWFILFNTFIYTINYFDRIYLWDWKNNKKCNKFNLFWSVLIR